MLATAPDARLVALFKRNYSYPLGITLGGQPTERPIITRMLRGALAHRSGRISVGDTLIAINGVEVRGHAEASRRLALAHGEVYVSLLRPGEEEGMARHGSDGISFQLQALVERSVRMQSRQRCQGMLACLAPLLSIL
eukprot:2831787-Prymnesium_polylepis.1